MEIKNRNPSEKNCTIPTSPLLPGMRWTSADEAEKHGTRLWPAPLRHVRCSDSLLVASEFRELEQSFRCLYSLLVASEFRELEQSFRCLYSLLAASEFRELEQSFRCLYSLLAASEFRELEQSCSLSESGSIARTAALSEKIR
jgi:hypothetical protein